MLQGDPEQFKRLEDARLRKTEFLARRAEAGDPTAKRARQEQEELQPAPSRESEVRTQQADPEAKSRLDKNGDFGSGKDDGLVDEEMDAQPEGGGRWIIRQLNGRKKTLKNRLLATSPSRMLTKLKDCSNPAAWQRPPRIQHLRGGTKDQKETRHGAKIRNILQMIPRWWEVSKLQWSTCWVSEDCGMARWERRFIRESTIFVSCSHHPEL